MPTVAISPSTLVHSCEGMYFKPSITVRATHEARSSVIASTVPSPRLALARVAQGAHPNILSTPRPARGVVSRARDARAFDRASDDVRTSARGPSHHIRVVRSRRRRRTGGVRARADRGHAHGRERGGLLRPSQERRSRRHRAKFVRRRVRTTRATTRRTIARVGASRVCVFIHR